MKGRRIDSFPVKPQRIVSDTRLALGDSDIVLVDTGALKMWMARLYPTFRQHLSYFKWPVNYGVRSSWSHSSELAYPERKVLAAGWRWRVLDAWLGIGNDCTRACPHSHPNLGRPEPGFNQMENGPRASVTILLSIFKILTL